MTTNVLNKWLLLGRQLLSKEQFRSKNFSRRGNPAKEEKSLYIYVKNVLLTFVINNWQLILIRLPWNVRLWVLSAHSNALCWLQSHGTLTNLFKLQGHNNKKKIPLQIF